MNVALVDIQVDITTTICKLVQERIDAGDNASVAGQYALDRIREQGLSDALLDRWGSWIMSDIWQRHYVAATRAKMWAQRGRPLSVPPVSGVRRVDLTLLKDDGPGALETLWLVDGDWICLGDMAKHHLRELADKYYQLTENSRRKAEFFDKLATDLPNDKVVRMAFSEASVRAMLEECGV